MLKGSVALALRAREVKPGSKEFTSVGTEPGPQGSPRSAVFKAQDGWALPQINSTEGPVILIHMGLRIIHSFIQPPSL